MYNSQYQIFISYSRKNAEEISKKINDDLELNGVKCIYDKNLGYTSSIKDFMGNAKKTDFVLMLIDEAFMKSKYCMFENTVICR